MKRLARPLEAMRAHYDVVVVGSGYGGSIAACRLAGAGRSVCLLERGKEMLPGEFPASGWEAMRDIQAVSRSGRHVGSRTALLDFRLNDDINMLVGCGLGGGSLINANVALRAGDYVFDERWPTALRGPGVLDEWYAKAEDMLRPVPFPGEQLPPKSAALQLAAQRTGQGDAFVRPPITVNFTDGPNHVGVEQRACIQCGDCCSGCNYSAKNTTLMNYLPEAARHGAEIFTTVEVRTVHREAGRWVVTYRSVGEGHGGGEAFVTGDVVVLSAGTLGSTEILLRSKVEHSLPLSDRLGARFSGNGDVIGFAYDTDCAVNGVGRGARTTGDAVSPCITGMIDRRDRPALADRILVQDAAIPSAIGRLLPAVFLLASAVEGGEDGERTIGLAKAGRELASVARGPYTGPVHRSATYLITSSDDDDGQIRLRRDRAGVDWPGVGGRPPLTRDNSDLAELAEKLNGSYLASPLWFKGRDLMTVHPLGGCVMADDAGAGVVNHKGQVFAGRAGEEVHDGLYVSDGAMVPSPLGVNPFLTISALGERNVARLASDRGWDLLADSDPAGQDQPVEEDPAAPPPVGLRFRETMRGFMSFGEGTCSSCYRRGQVDGSTFEHHLTIVSEDLPAMLADAARPAAMSGTVVAPDLSPRPLQARGTFQLFDVDRDSVETNRMIYRMELTAEDGRIYDFVGRKVIHGQGIRNMWSDTTTLFFDLTERGGDGRVGHGVLRVTVPELLRLLTTIDVTGAPDMSERTTYVRRFLTVFLRVLWRTYAGVLDVDYDFMPRTAPPTRALRAPSPERHEVRTEDGARIVLTRYPSEVGPSRPVILAPGFGVTASSFAATTVDENLVERLAAEGYDVWLLDYRASPVLVSDSDVRSAAFTIDDIAAHDWPAAVEEVRRVTGAAEVQVVAHCVASMSFLMAMTKGLEGIRSAVCSQLTVHAPTNWVSHVKAGLHVADVFEAIGLRVLNTDAKPTLGDKALDVILHLNPLLSGERCHNPVCRRIFGIYGPSYKHGQLNEATHRALHTWFGRSSDLALEQMATIVRAGVAVDVRGRDRYLPHLDRIRIPILFLAGDENRLFYPTASALTARRLRQVSDPDLFTRAVVPGYGHMDCFIGRRASEDVFPHIVRHLDLHAGALV